MRNFHRRLKQRGSSLAEFIYAVPAVLLLGLGSVQAGLIYHGKSTLNYATFEAARHGAVNHAQFDAMKAELSYRLAPLYGGDGTATKAAQAMAKAKAASLLPLRTNIRILNPTPAAFDDWGEMSLEAGVRAIPNSHLRHRVGDRNTVGAQSGLNLHDANLLKIKVTHGFEMKIPVVSDVIAKGMLLADPDNAHYYAQKQLPITSVVTVRMQNEAWEQDWEAGTVAPLPETEPEPGTTDGTTTGNDLVPEGETTSDTAGGETGDTDDTNGTTTTTTDDTTTGTTDQDDLDDDIECESTWEDARYTADTDNRWWNPLDWEDDVKAAAAVVWDFFEGALAGLGDQVEDLWNLLKDPTVLWDVAKAFITDPKGTITAIVEDLGEQAQRVLNCGPKDIGRVIGQNINPAIAIKLLGKLGSISGNAKLADYADDFSRRFQCASFPAGTEIWTPDGRVAIENIVVGTVVNSRNEFDFIDEPQSVSMLLGRVADGYQHIKTEAGIIRTTPEHPLWVQGKGWVVASDVVTEDPLATINGDVLVLTNLYVERATQVFNFSVANTPNYFAGEMGLWVHNAGRRSCWDADELNLGSPVGRRYDTDIYEIEVDGETVRVYVSPDDGRIYDFDRHPPTIRTADGLRDRIDDDIQAGIVQYPGTSRGLATTKDGRILNSPEKPFANLDTGKGLLGDKPNKQIAGINKNGNQFTVTDPDAYLNELRDLYDQNGTPLHPDTERLIRQHIENGGPFDTRAGVPGTHVEIQALNDLYTQAGGADNLSQVTIATIQTDGADFPACTNCGSILDGDPNVTIVTGRKN